MAASLVPVASEPYFTNVVFVEQKIYLPILVATVGNILGGLTTFLIGKKGGELILKKLDQENKVRFKKAENYLKKYGSYALVISWVPFIGDFVVTLAGALNLPFWQSMIAMSIGKFLRYLFLAYATLGVIKLFG